MIQSRHVVFDAHTSRWICQHCGKGEYITALQAELVILQGSEFLSTHAVCPSSREVDEQRMGETRRSLEAPA